MSGCGVEWNGLKSDDDDIRWKTDGEVERGEKVIMDVVCGPCN